MNRNAKRPHSALSKKRRRRVPPCLAVTWSDGVLRFQGQENGPSPEQRRPDNPAGYLVEVPRGSKKEIMWLQKLGAGLIEHFQRDLKQIIKQPIYIHKLPHGYRLFQTMGKSNRTDLYLYGHPMGPRKRFRSPKEFEKHLIWLASDITRNPANCTCDKCKGDGHREPPEMPLPSGYPHPMAEPAVPVAPKRLHTDHEPVPTPPQQAVPSKGLQSAVLHTHAQPPPLETALLSSRTHSERVNDLTPVSLNIYRRGEQVWFQTGLHWALGVVLDIPSLSMGKTDYKLAPLTSPLRCETSPLMTGLRPEQLRPWVAWTTPPVTNPALAYEEVDYENLPWQKESANPTIEVDASIIKSREVDTSWTLIDRLTPESDYAGIYHGAEKFWVGDAVRLKPGSHPSGITSHEIFIVSTIRDTRPDIQRGVRVKETGVQLTGDLYRMVSTKQQASPSQILPAAVLQDLKDRSARIAPADPDMPFWTYILLDQNTSIKLEDVKGRWYPSEALYHIINGAAALNAPGGINQQAWDDTGSKMNEMGTGGHGARLGRRRYDERHQAFAHAIKSDIVFDSLPTAPQLNFPPVMTSVAPTAGMSSGANHGGHVGTVAGGNEVVDLTGEDPMGFLEDDDFMRKMGEDAASFLADDTDGFYGGL